MSAVVLGGSFFGAGPAYAQIRQQAESCLVDEVAPQVRTVLERSGDDGYSPPIVAKQATNNALLACERKHQWKREQTVNAGSYATFVLRFRRAEAEAKDRGMIRSRMEKLKYGASLLQSGDKYNFSIWLSRAGYPSFAHLRETRDFAYFDAWMNLLAAGKRLETGKL